MGISRKSARKKARTVSKEALKAAKVELKLEQAKALSLQNEKELEIAKTRLKSEDVINEALPMLKTSLRSAVLGEMVIMMTMALRDEFGFGKKRLEQFTRRFADIIHSVERNNVDLYDMNEAIKEETGYDVEKSIRKHTEDIKCEHEHEIYKSMSIKCSA